MFIADRVVFEGASYLKVTFPPDSTSVFDDEISGKTTFDAACTTSVLINKDRLIQPTAHATLYIFFIGKVYQTTRCQNQDTTENGRRPHQVAL